MTLPDSWVPGAHTASGVTHPTFRKGTGPGVVVVHEIPGLTAEVVGFADELVEAGYTVVLPHLFGEAGRSMSTGQVAKVFPRVCISREFTVLAAGETSPVVGWLRDLASTLHDELGGPGVGALGMCFTGGFALAMAVDTSVAAPVLCQPSLPLPIGRRRAGDLGLSPADLDSVRQRGCSVLGLQFDKDPTTGTRFDTLDRELGNAFIRVDLPGRGHSTVTVHRRQEAVDAVLSFFDAQLR
ncbi:Dienelactone hydrolase family protein [Nocardioides dokdonensis FR1436]|uniref:Dienelactone hydrolase family protein n=1 Tax=Nocardioides dokdonensis FR1436 TaxID=1300347 RepID=A0A1A9GNI0_9ACTN|nr:dienelactone hydrolase family protein [Nocardioides dokdonensis]ANH39887.1 Dienelactone hydrolase family protein [Nocardioides dokdonensis FR1436]